MTASFSHEEVRFLLLPFSSSSSRGVSSLKAQDMYEKESRNSFIHEWHFLGNKWSSSLKNAEKVICHDDKGI